MNRLCVFCGSSSGVAPEYAQAAKQLGRVLALRGIGLVYGGGKVGLMGILADSVLANGGEVTGVIPQIMADKEVAHRGVTELRVVGSMHERKALMAQLSDGFVAMPGGIGTMEELFEIWTWSQLGLHQKPCGLLNVLGYFNHLTTFVDRMVAENFLKDIHRAILVVSNDPEALLDRLMHYEPPKLTKFLVLETT